MAGFASALVGEIFEFCSLGFLGMSKGARRVYNSGYGYDATIEDDYAIVRTPSSRGQGLKFPRGLRPGKFDELAKMDLCSPGCKVPAVTIFGDPSKKWIPFDEGVIQIDNRRSMTVFKHDGSVESITIDVPMWGFRLELPLIEAFWRCGYILRRFSVVDKNITWFSCRMLLMRFLV